MALKYVLITPARNEQAFLEATIIAVLHQTIRPLLWVIVSDGSTDRTEEIVRRYSTKNPWIELISLPQRHDRHFAGKVHAFNAGYERVKRLSYDVIANLDADVSLEDPEYFAFLLTKFAQDSQLGVAGCPFREGTTQDRLPFLEKRTRFWCLSGFPTGMFRRHRWIHPAQNRRG